MGWFDQLIHSGYQMKAYGATAVRNLGEHLNEKGDEILDWYANKKAEHLQLIQERKEANQRIKELKDKTKFAGMTMEQRAAQVDQLTKEMPGTLSVLHAHPIAKTATAPLRIFGNAISSLWRQGPVVAGHITPGSNTMLLLLALFYHIALVFFLEPTIMTRLWINVGMILMVIFLIFDSSERNGDTYRTLFLFVFLLEIVIPYATNTFTVLRQFSFVRLYIANSFIIWTWIYYAVFVRGKSITSGPTKIARILIIIFWLGVVFSFIGTSMVDFNDKELDTAGTEQWYAAKQIALKAADGWATLWEGVTGGFSNIQEIFKMRMKAATGEYYYGVVEENEKEPLGVYLEDLKASQKEFEENEPITVYATLKARTLDDTITATIGCYAGTEKNKVLGTVYPDDSFEIATLAQEELDCSFEKLSEGTNKVTYTADFNFETIGYLKRYFADRDAIIAANRQNIDLLDEYQITDKEPVAHYTNGPVALGMGPEGALIGISEGYAVKPRLAVTLDSSTKGWGGVIKTLDELILIIPKEMTLDTAQCTDPDWTAYTVDDCVQSELKYKSTISQDCNEDEGCIEKQCTSQLGDYNAYQLNTNNKNYKDIKDFITISCRLNVDDTTGLLGATPIATHYFYVKTRYDYEVSEDTSVIVKEAEGAVSLPGETVSGKTSATEVPTFGTGDDEKELQYIFYHYGDYLFAAEEKFDVPVCALASIIAHTSSADPNYYKEGLQGLMGIPDNVAEKFASAAGVSVSSSQAIYDAETNIDIGAAYMKDLLASLGAYSSDFGKTYYVFMQGQAGNTISNEDAELFGAYFFSTAKKCGEMGLKYSKLEEELKPEPSLLEGSVAYDGVTEASPVVLYLVQYQNKYLVVNLTKEEGATAATPPDATLRYGNSVLDSHPYVFENEDIWMSFDGYPFVQILFSSVNNTVDYRVFRDFVMTPIPLLEDEPTVLVSDALFVEYTGKALEFQLANNPNNPKDLDTICTIPWYDYIAYATCEEEEIPGIIVRNINTGESTRGKFASVQIEWNSEKQLEGLKS